MQNKETTNITKNDNVNIVKINQQTIAFFKRKIKKLVESLKKEEKIKPEEKYDKILSFLCLTDDEKLNENKLFQKLKELQLINDDKNIKYFIPTEIKNRLEQSLLHTKYNIANMPMESNLNTKEKSKDDIVKEQEILREKLKNTTELTQRLIEFDDMQKNPLLY